MFRASITADDGKKVGKFFFRIVNKWARGAKDRHDEEMDELREFDPDSASRTMIFPQDFHGLIHDPDSPGEVNIADSCSFNLLS
jgi:hypothetical protein